MANLLETFWGRWFGIDEAALAERKRRLLDETGEAERQRLDRESAKQKAEEDEQASEDILLASIISAEIRLASQALSKEITEAIQSVQVACERAHREQEAARAALQKVRNSAITLGDGSRVYFTADGLTLYDESACEVSDQRIATEARAILATRTDATTYETFFEASERLKNANFSVEQLSAALDKLDTLKGRVDRGLADQQDLTSVRQELAQILDGLPADFVRNGARFQKESDNRDPETVYRETSGYDASGDFAKANKPLPKIDPSDAPERPPAYKAAPEF